MKHYKVIALSVAGLGNKIFSAGDSVTEDHFIPGRADNLVTEGLLEQVGEDNVKPRDVGSESEMELVEVESPAQSIIANLQSSLGQPSKTNDVLGIDSISRKDIIKTLTELGIPFEPNASKKELYTLWLSKDNY